MNYLKCDFSLPNNIFLPSHLPLPKGIHGQTASEHSHLIYPMNLVASRFFLQVFAQYPSKDRKSITSFGSKCHKFHKGFAAKTVGDSRKDQESSCTLMTNYMSFHESLFISDTSRMCIYLSYILGIGVVSGDRFGMLSLAWRCSDWKVLLPGLMPTLLFFSKNA